VARRDGEDAAFLGHDAALDPRRRVLEARDGQIGRVLQQFPHHGRTVAPWPEGEVDARVPLAHRPCEAPDRDLGRRTGEAEPHTPTVPAVRRLDLGAGPLPHPHDRAAGSSNARPAEVSSMRRVVRSNSWVPKSASKARIVRLR
jgi:hypothetical protein